MAKKAFFGSVGITATDTQASAASSTVTIAAIPGYRIKILGFAGGSNAQAVKVELKFGSTVKMTLHGPANAPVGWNFTDVGPEAAVNEAVSVVTTPASSGQCEANLIYAVVPDVGNP